MCCPQSSKAIAGAILRAHFVGRRGADTGLPSDLDRDTLALYLGFIVVM